MSAADLHMEIVDATDLLVDKARSMAILASCDQNVEKVVGDQFYVIAELLGRAHAKINKAVDALRQQAEQPAPVAVKAKKGTVK